MKKINLNIGDTILVDIVKPNRGKFPIGRYKGMICKLTLSEGIKFLEYGCTVKARVAIINQKSLHILVDSIERSAETNEKIIEKKMEKLKEMTSIEHVKHVVPKKGVNTYNY